METFATRIAAVDTPVVNDNGPVVPTIWWHNGNKQAKTPGLFYLKAAALQQEPAEPWTPTERFTGESGFTATTLHLALITWRQQPYHIVEIVSGGEKRKDRRYIAEWEPGAQIHTEIVCLVEGIAEPVVWSFHGMTGRAIMGKQGIFSAYRNGLLRAAEQAAGKRLPLWTFWLPLTTRRDAKNQPTYTDTGHGSLVTLPMLAWPNRPETDLLDLLFVGEEWVSYGYGVRAQFDHWRSQRRGIGQSGNGYASANSNGHSRSNDDEPLPDEDELPL